MAGDDDGERGRAAASAGRRAAVSLALAVVVAYVGICALVYFVQGSLIYFPSPVLDVVPGDLGMSSEDLSLAAPDGTTIHGWYLPARAPRATVIWCHGNAGNISHRLGIARQLTALELDVVLFDYRGYGLSGGSPSEQNTYEDADVVWRYLTGERGVPAAEVIVWGRSLGGAVAADLARRRAPRALVVESSFSSAVDVARRYYRWLPVELLSRFRYDAASRVAEVAGPKLFAHSPDDDVIPYDFGRRLYEAAAEPKRFVELVGGHNDENLAPGTAYVAAVEEFLAEVLEGD